MQLALSLSIAALRSRIRRAPTTMYNFLPLGSTGLVTSDGKAFLALEE